MVVLAGADLQDPALPQVRGRFTKRSIQRKARQRRLFAHFSGQLIQQFF
jgi:hypothetical protein